MKWSALLLILALTLSITAAACGSSNTSNESAGITREKLIDGITSSWAEMKTGQGEGGWVGILEGPQGTLTVSQTIKGTFDWAHSQSKLDVSTAVNFNGDIEIHTATIYMLGTLAYLLIQDEGLPDLWIYGEAPESYRMRYDWVSQQIELLHSSKIEILPTEEVAGIPCYVAKITPDIDTLVEIWNSTLGSSVSEESPQRTVDKFAVKSWFAQDTFFPLKLHDEYESTYSDGDTFHGVRDVSFHDFNKDISIQLPVEAYRAQYVGPLDKLTNESPNSVP